MSEDSNQNFKFQRLFLDIFFFFLVVELENICACIYMAMLEIGTPYAQGTMLSGCVTFIVDKRN